MPLFDRELGGGPSCAFFECLWCLARSTAVDLAEHEDLELVVEREYTCTGDTTENVGTCTLEERLGALLGDDLRTGVEHGLVVDGRSGRHHHATTNSIERIRSKTSTNSNTPSEEEGGEEASLELTDENNRLKRVVDTKVETTVDDDTNDRRDETTVETGDTVGGEGLPVDVDETVELTFTSALCGRLGVVGETGTSIVEGVDEEEGRSTGSTTRCNVTGEPLPVTVLLPEAEEGLEVILEGKVEGLGWEVTNDVGGVTSPESGEALVTVRAGEAVDDAVVLVAETTLLDHFILILDEELDTLDGSSRCLCDGSRDTTHHKVDGKVLGGLDLFYSQIFSNSSPRDLHYPISALPTKISMLSAQNTSAESLLY